MSEPERPCRVFSCEKNAVPNTQFCYIHQPYKIPCGRVMGHGDYCTEGHMCGGCEEIAALRKQLVQMADVLNSLSNLLDDALTRMRGG